MADADSHILFKYVLHFYLQISIVLPVFLEPITYVLAHILIDKGLGEQNTDIDIMVAKYECTNPRV
jgi:hypothetical protein